MAYNSLMVFTGNANPKLAADVASATEFSLGRANVGRFSDGEVSVELQEHVRGRTSSSCNRPARRATTT
jgi:ribose-phosphate pyrophosphokinase